MLKPMTDRTPTWALTIQCGIGHAEVVIGQLFGSLDATDVTEDLRAVGDREIANGLDHPISGRTVRIVIDGRSADCQRYPGRLNRRGVSGRTRNAAIGYLTEPMPSVPVALRQEP